MFADVKSQGTQRQAKHNKNSANFGFVWWGTNQKEGNQRVERPAIFVSHSGLLLLFSGLKSSESFWPTKIIHEAYSISRFFFGPSKPTILLSTEQWKMGPWLFRECSRLYYPIRPNSIGIVLSQCKDVPLNNQDSMERIRTQPTPLGFFQLLARSTVFFRQVKCSFVNSKNSNPLSSSCWECTPRGDGHKDLI